MRSVDPSSSVTEPPPDQLPASPANGPDSAWPAALANAVTKNATAANAGRRALAKIPDELLILLTGRFPSAAAGYAS
jgi:hypothetical protein